jgi:hypothetical protein
MRRQNRKWFACFSCEVETQPLPESALAVGIEVGLEKFAALWDGSFVQNPRFFGHAEKALAKAQRHLSKANKGTLEGKRRRKVVKVVARLQERIRHRRHNFCHQEARQIVNRFGTVAVEKLLPQKMMKNHCLAKSIPKVLVMPRGHSFDKFFATRLKGPVANTLKLTPPPQAKLAPVVASALRKRFGNVGIFAPIAEHLLTATQTPL